MLCSLVDRLLRLCDLGNKGPTKAATRNCVPQGRVLMTVSVANLRFVEFVVWNGIKVNINNTNRLCYNENGKSH